MRKYCLIKHFKTVATYLVAVIILASCLFVTVQSAQADSFTITSDQNDNDPNNPKAVTDQQTLNGNEVGLIEEGGELNVTNAAEKARPPRTWLTAKPSVESDLINTKKSAPNPIKTPASTPSIIIESSERRALATPTVSTRSAISFGE